MTSLLLVFGQSCQVFVSAEVQYVFNNEKESIVVVILHSRLTISTLKSGVIIGVICINHDKDTGM